MKQVQSNQLLLSNNEPNKKELNMLTLSDYYAFVDKIRQYLILFAEKNAVNNDCLIVSELKSNNGFSLVFNKHTFVKLEYYSTLGLRLYIKINILSQIPDGYKLKNGMMIKTFRVIDDNIFDLICDVIQLFNDNFVPNDSFGCCGRYLECSNNMKCTHPDNNYSKGCYYRANLEKGKIFYGANKII